MEQTFYEALDPQPPPSTLKVKQTIKGTTDNERIWIGYDLNETRNMRMFCPYRVGQHIPHPITNITATQIDNYWYWKVTIDVSLETTPETCPKCDHQWHPIIGCTYCGLSPQDFFN